MHTLVRNPRTRYPANLTLRTPPNWTAVGFFGLLGTLHLSIAVPAFFAGRWEGYLSLLLAIVFITASVVASCYRFELRVFPLRRELRLRHGIRRLFLERSVPFASIDGVRLNLSPAGNRDSTIELICVGDEIVCPPTSIPREQALYLAMTLNVPLIRSHP